MFKVVVSKHIYDLISSATEENTGFKFRQDHCYRLLKNITHVYNLNRDRSDDGFVSLKSTYLQNIVHDYKFYMDWMESKGIIQIYHSYQNSHPDPTKNYNKHYRIVPPPENFMPDDRDRIVQVAFKENTAFRIFLTSVKETRGLTFLVNWLKKITIVEQLAHDLNDEIYQEDRISPRIGYKKGLFNYVPYFIDPDRAKIARKDSIVAILTKQFYMSRDTTSGRLHSNVTGLSSRIFPALRIQGMPLVGYDIANSQPFICSALINFSIEDAKKREQFPQTFSNYPILTPISSTNPITPSTLSLTNPLLPSNPNNPTQSIPLFTSNPTLIPYIQTYLPNLTNPTSLLVMLEEFLSEPDLIGVLEFQNLTTSGNLYQEIARNVFGFEYVSENKRKVKDLFFTLFFTKPGNNKGGMSKFKERYLGVHSIISAIKSKSPDDNFFPILLQCLESYYILEKVCKRMNDECPRAPLFTKHDSVYTIAEYLPLLKTVMEDEAIKLFGMCPKLNEC